MIRLQCLRGPYDGMWYELEPESRVVHHHVAGVLVGSSS